MNSSDLSLCGVVDAAAAKGVHEETVRRAIRSGRLPAVRIGKNFVIRATDLEAWQPYYEKAPRRREVRDDQRPRAAG
jgi:excisionase family DNA binding protein